MIMSREKNVGQNQNINLDEIFEKCNKFQILANDTIELKLYAGRN
jgi:hypothetical protein